jgi:hypothetical protein
MLRFLKIFTENIFVFNKEKHVYENITKKNNIRILIFLLLIFLSGFITAICIITPKHIDNTKIYEISYETKYDDVIGSIEWRDSIFTTYSKKADLYLKKFKGTPIKGDMLSLAAQNAYDSTGILLPLELALSQAQWESGMGLLGRSPKNNPFNIGEYDDGTVLYFESTFDGIQAYYYLMCRLYLSCKSLDELFISFVNCNGHRYAASGYESRIRYQYYVIKQWLKDNYK